MDMVNGEHVTLSGSVKLEIAVTTLGILEENICVAVCTYERGTRGLGIGWDWRLEIVSSAEESDRTVPF